MAIHGIDDKTAIRKVDETYRSKDITFGILFLIPKRANW